jgi:hypothetical protein
MSASVIGETMTVKRSKRSAKCTGCYKDEKMSIRLVASASLGVLWIVIFMTSALRAPDTFSSVLWTGLVASSFGVLIAVASVLGFYTLIVWAYLQLQKGKVGKTDVVPEGSCPSCSKIFAANQ